MKKWGLLLVIVCCLCLAAVKITQDKIEIHTFDQEDKAEHNQKEEITREQIFQGNLLLVNNDYPVRQNSIKSDIVNLFQHEELIEGYDLLNNDIHLSMTVARKFSEMIAAAEKDGVHHFIIRSGFRDFEEQKALHEELGADYALPAGFSEHNLGLSLDVGSVQMTMDKADEGKWIENNAWKYGFILRYPADKTGITGIQYEPWHIRYVGLPHSAIMQEKNFVLEEYLDYLKDKTSISVTVNDKKYTVTYYPVSENKTIDIPENRHYEISGNNVDGVIVTVYK